MADIIGHEEFRRRAAEKGPRDEQDASGAFAGQSRVVPLPNIHLPTVIATMHMVKLINERKAREAAQETAAPSPSNQ